MLVLKNDWRIGVWGICDVIKSNKNKIIPKYRANKNTVINDGDELLKSYAKLQNQFYNKSVKHFTTFQARCKLYISKNRHCDNKLNNMLE